MAKLKNSSCLVTLKFQTGNFRDRVFRAWRFAARPEPDISRPGFQRPAIFSPEPSLKSKFFSTLLNLMNLFLKVCAIFSPGFPFNLYLRIKKSKNPGWLGSRSPAYQPGTGPAPGNFQNQARSIND